MPKRKRRKPVGPRADKGVPWCVNTVGLRVAVARLRAALQAARKGSPRGPHRVTNSKVARLLGIETSTLVSWLRLSRWPPDHQLTDIIAIAAVLEESLAGGPVAGPILDIERDIENDPFASMLAPNAMISKTFRWSLDTTSTAGYCCSLPAVDDEST